VEVDEKLLALKVSQFKLILKRAALPELPACLTGIVISFYALAVVCAFSLVQHCTVAFLPIRAKLGWIQIFNKIHCALALAGTS
jgi:hypothetical protein